MSEISEVVMPGRILGRHVGGNTTYSRNIASGLRSRGVQVSEMPYVKNPYGTAALESMYGLRRRAQGTILHYVADTGPLLKTRTPAVVTVHGVASRWTPVARTALQERAWRYRVSRAIAATDAVITVSESSADDVADIFNVPRAQIKVIHHGIEVERFARPVALSEEIRHAVPGDYLLYLGNIEPRKNVDSLVQAMSSGELAKAGIPLVIAGRPAWNYSETMKLIEQTANVIYLGFVSDTDRIALMQRCRLFVFPSHYEGFGFPVLEALAAGAPVLSSRAGSLKEVAGPSFELSGLSPEEISSSVARALATKASSDREQHGRTWARMFSWDLSVEKHLDVYRELLA